MRRGFLVLFAAVLLCGCTDADWDHTMSYVGLGTDKPAPTAPAPAAPAQMAAAPAAPGNKWCVEVAKAALREAAKDGFDAATQQHRAQVTYRQCLSDPGTAPQ